MIPDDPGYRVFEDVFDRSEMVRVAEGLSAEEPQRTRAGARHVLNVPPVRDLSSDPRILDIAQQFVGPAATSFRATLFDKSAAADDPRVIEVPRRPAPACGFRSGVNAG